MRSDQLTGDQLESLKTRVRPMLRYVRGLQASADKLLDPEDPLRLATITAREALQDLLTELHYLSVDPGSAGRADRQS